jgi:hypothetical protein
MTCPIVARGAQARSRYLDQVIRAPFEQPVVAVERLPYTCPVSSDSHSLDKLMCAESRE